MILYQVQIALDSPIETAWLTWMQEIHVPDVLRTGCFAACRIFRLSDSDRTEPVYVMQYECDSLEDYRRYREQFAAALQKDHSDRFAGRFRGARQILEEIATVRAGDK
jgi:hypothetical protein